jgi:uncharacterized membrane protein
MVVGDDAQCIYSWRGANFENIMTFPDRHPGTVIHRIETNYRSTPQILALANGVLLAQPKGRHFDKELKAARGPAQKPFLVPAMDAREQARSHGHASHSHGLPSSFKQVALKTLTYGLMHFIVAVTVAYAITRDIRIALAIGIVEPLVQTLFFTVHDRIWSRIEARRARKAKDLAAA